MDLCLLKIMQQSRHGICITGHVAAHLSLLASEKEHLFMYNHNLYCQITEITALTPQFSALCWHRLLSPLDKSCHVLDKMQACSFCDTLCMVYLYTRMLIWLVCDDECVITGGRSWAGFIKAAVVSFWWMLRAISASLFVCTTSQRDGDKQPWTEHPCQQMQKNVVCLSVCRLAGVILVLEQLCLIEFITQN